MVLGLTGELDSVHLPSSASDYLQASVTLSHPLLMSQTGTARDEESLSLWPTSSRVFQFSQDFDSVETTCEDVGWDVPKDNVDIAKMSVVEGSAMASWTLPPPSIPAVEPEPLSPQLESPSLSPELPITPRSKKRWRPSNSIDPNDSNDFFGEALERLEKMDAPPAHVMALRLARRAHLGRPAGDLGVAKSVEHAGMVPGVWQLAERIRDGTYSKDTDIRGSRHCSSHNV
jgi:hypothetical protein